jgi:hypothetical protein
MLTDKRVFILGCGYRPDVWTLATVKTLAPASPCAHSACLIMLHLPTPASIVPHVAVTMRMPAHPHMVLHVHMEARAYCCVFRFGACCAPVHAGWDQIYFCNIQMRHIQHSDEAYI